MVDRRIPAVLGAISIWCACGPPPVAPTPPGEPGVAAPADPGAVAPTPASQPLTHSVRFVYMVSADREERDDYRVAIEGAAVSVQQWYAGQLAGATFQLNDPVVEVIHSDQLASWFYDHPNGAKDDWGYNNTLDEAARLLGAGHEQKYTWVIYSDGPGNMGRGGGGVTCMPEDDLLGLIGEHPTQKSIERWIGGMGHELGHALGLPHPDDTEKDADALMWAGFYSGYPDTAYLTDADKATLKSSPFIQREWPSPR